MALIPLQHILKHVAIICSCSPFKRCFYHDAYPSFVIFSANFCFYWCFKPNPLSQLKMVNSVLQVKWSMVFVDWIDHFVFESIQWPFCWLNKFFQSLSFIDVLKSSFVFVFFALFLYFDPFPIDSKRLEQFDSIQRGLCRRPRFQL